MSLETEAVLDRRRLRRSLSLWRVLTVLAAAAAIGALAMYGTSDDPVIGGKKQIARVALVDCGRNHLIGLRRLRREIEVSAY